MATTARATESARAESVSAAPDPSGPRRVRALAGSAALVLLVVLGGCGGSPAPPAVPAVPTGSAASAPPAGPPSVDPGRSAEDAACAANEKTANTVRGIAAALEKGPVLPAGVALFLLDARSRAAAAQLGDPELAAAHAELVAAVDDLDAQGEALLPPGGSPARDAVQLDAARVLAAVEQIDRLCRRTG